MCWLQAIPRSAASRSAAASAGHGPCNSTPVPSGRLISRASPGCSPDLSQGDGVSFTVRVTRTPRLAGTVQGCATHRVATDQLGALFIQHRADAQVPSSSCCSLVGTIGSVIVAMALDTAAPQAQRSEQACRGQAAVEPGVTHQGWKASTLCSSS